MNTTIHIGENLICECGNEPEADGFFPCDSQGNEIEPLITSEWNGLYVCARCQNLHRFIQEESK